ncbi:MAG: DNA-formamidopyrimidine glycosylase [Anaerolineae bacterium]|nr:MAG: DNA-formamidopyrimidine glycosylase [Anaerolineae bacterium]
MPELPEVESTANRLRDGRPPEPALLGKTIARAEVYWPRTVATPAPRAFRQRIAGQKVMAIGRRAKFIVITLSQDTLIIHLRMSGDVLVAKEAKPAGRFTRLALWFTDGWQLAFDDARKFGRMWLVDDPDSVLGGLGPEPLDAALTPATFHALLAARGRALKPLLLDQAFIAGIGNIYADESLHLARLHPLTRANSLTKDQAAALLKAIRKVLRAGIRRNGASIDWVYRGGGYQNEFRVYQRTDEPCMNCGTPVRRITVGQRGTHFCPTCQPTP